MKKIITSFLIGIAALFVLLSFLDSGGNYAAEKELWRINKQFMAVAKDPKTVPDVAFNRIIQQYDRFVERFPESKLVPLAEILSARALILKKDYDKATIKLENFIKKYNDSPDIAVQALAELGNAYTLQKDWGNVLKVYQKILRDYPMTELGLRTPVLIAQFHSKRNEPLQVQKAYEDAIVYYKQLSSQHPDSYTEYSALRLLAVCYFALHRWPEAVNTSGELLIKYSKRGYMDGRRAQAIITAINSLSIIEMKNYDLPIKIYQDFINANPNHPFNGQIQKLINDIKLLKEKNINVMMKK